MRDDLRLLRPHDHLVLPSPGPCSLSSNISTRVGANTEAAFNRSCGLLRFGTAAKAEECLPLLHKGRLPSTRSSLRQPSWTGSASSGGTGCGLDLVALEQLRYWPTGLLTLEGELTSPHQARHKKVRRRWRIFQRRGMGTMDLLEKAGRVRPIIR